MLRHQVALSLMVTISVVGVLSIRDAAVANEPNSNKPEQQQSQVPTIGANNANKADGVIGISLHMSAEHIGDPATLYVGKVHPAGPAQKAGLRHGDELVSVDDTPLAGKSYEQVVNMVRGATETSVKLGIKRDNEGLREVSVIRIASDQLVQGRPGHGNYKDPSPTQP